MAAPIRSNSGTASWDTPDAPLLEVLSGLDDSYGVKNHLSLPQLQPSLPIIRPPEGCEKMKPTEFKDLHYQDLPTPTSIRLLKVFRGKDSYDDFELFRPPVKCSIIVADLNDNVSYDALSYTWGDPCTLYLNPREISPQEAWAARPFDIEVDGKPVSVGVNLYTALLGLRSYVTHQNDPRFSDSPQSTGYFWIDAMCINQKDLKEKSSQVMMMSRIYKQAHLVFAWLGGGDRLSRQALHDLNTIASLCANNKRDPKELRGFNITEDETYQKLGIPKLDYTSWIGMYLFFNRAWFKRAWIVQEIALAREPWFMCGKQVFNLMMVLMSLETLQRSRWLDQMRSLAEPLIQNYRTEDDYQSNITLAMSSVRLYRPRKTHLLNSNLGVILRDVRISMGTSKGLAKDGSAPKRPELLRLLEFYRFTEAGDPRDTVYAFLGLSSEQEINPLKVDYELKGEEVFVDAARHILDSMGNLKILSQKKITLDAESTLTLPSWVPDFTVQDFTTPINQHALFSASKGLGSVKSFYLPGDRLQLSGVKIDNIRYGGVSFQWAKLEEVSLLLEKVMPLEEQTRFETLWRTLLLDTFEEKTPAPTDCGKLLIEVLEKVILGLQVVATFNLRYAEELLGPGAQPGASSAGIEKARERLGVMYTAVRHILEQCTKEDVMILPSEFVEFENQWSKSKSQEEKQLIVEKFHDELSDRLKSVGTGGDIQFLISAQGRRLLFVTERGFLGMGPQALEVGDEIWVLAGADVPFVLRPSKSSSREFSLVGEAYVHGAMQGEVVADIQEDNIRRVCLV
ncbi:Nn.00g104950.m01.CDS01 [Neocucurbitaria sp. VM-36]